MLASPAEESVHEPRSPPCGARGAHGAMSRLDDPDWTPESVVDLVSAILEDMGEQLILPGLAEDEGA